MKKHLPLAVCLAAVFLCSCGNSSAVDDIIASQEITVNSEAYITVTSSEPQNTTAAVAETSPQTDFSTKAVDEYVPEADVDLTTMSSTMVYAEVYNMVSTPDDYFGKRIKLRGQYYPFYADDTEKIYYYVIVADATACCQQGIEFIWDGGTHTYPDDYPATDSIVEISGIYSAYEENGVSYCYVDADSLVLIDDSNAHDF